MKRFIAISALIALVLLTGCSRTGGDEVTTLPYKHDTNATTAPQAPVTTAAADTTARQATRSDAWKANYSLTYTYTRGEDSFELREARCEDRFMSRDTGSGTTTYIIADGDDVDRYLVVPSQRKATHKLIASQSLSNIISGFMKLSTVDDDFTERENVVHVGSDTVAGRPAEKYIQRSYEDGEVTATAYVWIDTEYGFASKVETDADGGAGWELTEFTVGGVSGTQIVPELDGYDIEEEE